MISARVVEVLDQAGQTWGIRVLRYEIKNISPPHTVRNAMEMQVNAEREGRALIATAEGDKQSRINRSEGLKAELINHSEGEMQKVINEAEGQAEEIRAIAAATAGSINKISEAIRVEGGSEAFKLQLSERYIDVIRSLESSRIILPFKRSSGQSKTGSLILESLGTSKIVAN